MNDLLIIELFNAAYTATQLFVKPAKAAICNLVTFTPDYNL